ncbi:unnamed protein product [Meganyctiphanes norvegica]|uniref:Uncharacterized protein n=1 Tax=Meganyctiphanes norvegica TaxID=48144 RepID=A0AAV2QVH4_MEGNR
MAIIPYLYLSSETVQSGYGVLSAQNFFVNKIQSVWVIWPNVVFADLLPRFYFNSLLACSSSLKTRKEELGILYLYKKLFHASCVKKKQLQTDNLTNKKMQI